MFWLMIISGDINDTHMEELNSVQKFIGIQGWFLVTFFICLPNQLVLYRCLKNMIDQVGSKNKLLLLSVTFTAKLGLILS